LHGFEKQGIDAEKYTKSVKSQGLLRELAQFIHSVKFRYDDMGAMVR
jgi:hypothetical protein